MTCRNDVVVNSLPQTLVDIIRGLPDTNVASLVFALVGSAVLIAVKELSARYRHKLPFPIPVEIVVVSSLEFLQRHKSSYISIRCFNRFVTPVFLFHTGGGGHSRLGPSASS